MKASSSIMLGKKDPERVRKSACIRNLRKRARETDIEYIIKTITLNEDEEDAETITLRESKEEEAEATAKDHLPSKHTLSAIRLDEETDDPASSSKASGSKKDKEAITGAKKMTYKSLYVRSEMKLQALMERNHKLRAELDEVLAKIEVMSRGATSKSAKVAEGAPTVPYEDPEDIVTLSSTDSE